MERPPFDEVQQRKAIGSRELQAMLIVTDSESNSSTAEVAGQVESYCSIYILRYGLRALRMDSFFILSEMTDKTRRLAPAQYEPQTEQSPTFLCLLT